MSARLLTAVWCRWYAIFDVGPRKRNNINAERANSRNIVVQLLVVIRVENQLGTHAMKSSCGGYAFEKPVLSIPGVVEVIVSSEDLANLKAHNIVICTMWGT